MEGCNILVDDIVRVKSWEQMVKEYGSPNTVGDIYIHDDMVWFDSAMKELCGKEAQVVCVEYEPFTKSYSLLLADPEFDRWIITSRMVEVVELENVKAIEEGELSELM